MSHDHLIGLPYIEGRQDCYGLVLRYYKDVFGIELPNFARPTGWSEAGMDLLTRHYHTAGFEVLDVHPSEYKPGDVILIGIRNSHSNHAAVLVENGLILHHLYRNLSRTDRYAGIWRNCTLAIVRHKSNPYKPSASTINVLDLLPPRVRAKVEAATSGLSDTGT